MQISRVGSLSHCFGCRPDLPTLPKPKAILARFPAQAAPASRSRSTSSCFRPETGRPLSLHSCFRSSTFLAESCSLVRTVACSAATRFSFSAAALVTTSAKGSSSSSPASSSIGAAASTGASLISMETAGGPAISASNALVLSSSITSCFGSSPSENPVLCRFRGCSSSFTPMVALLAATMASAAADPGTTPKTSSGPSRRKLSRNSSNNSMAVAPGPSCKAMSLGSVLATASKSDQEELADIVPLIAQSFIKGASASRRFRSSRNAFATSGVRALAFASASCSEVGFKS
mmetsp:Transcript_184745/g.586038  ORF Transcript_184745/g.586038 Transcript_184745/m.586038 type:complete len:290 (+) Transcript_184745:128-997(+)